MVSWKSIFIVKLMTTWNVLSDAFKETLNKTSEFYEYVSNYFYGHHEKWLFVRGHTIPLSLNNLLNEIDTNCIYDNTITKLYYGRHNHSDIENIKLS